MEVPWSCLAVAALVVGLAWWLRSARPPGVRCPNCGSRAVGQIAKEPQALRSVDMATGEVGGGYTSLQTSFKLTYQCNNCRFRWTAEATETT